MATTDQTPADVYFTHESEQQVLGSILLNPTAIHGAAAVLTEADFGLVRHGYIWRAMLDLLKQGLAIDYATVCHRLKELNLLDDVGGGAYLTHLVQSVPTSMHAPVYVELVHRATIRRNLAIAADTIKAETLDGEKPVAELLINANRSLAEVSGMQRTDRGGTVTELASATYDSFEQHYRAKTRAMGISTGLNDLDVLMDGLQPERFIVVAGRPGMGKSSLLTRFALSAARNGKTPEDGLKVAYFLTEMTKQEIMWRMLAMDSGVNSRKIRDPRALSPREAERLTTAFGQYANLPIWMDDTPAATAAYITGQCALAHQVLGGLDLVLIDGMYKMASTFDHNGSRNDQVTEISGALKDLARTFRVPVVATHQLNRKCEERADKRPMLSDLRDSGSVEQDADCVIFAYRDVMYNEYTEFPNQADLIVAKNRDGPMGLVSCYFEPVLTSWMNGAVRRISLADLEEPEPPKRPTYQAPRRSYAAQSHPEATD